MAPIVAWTFAGYLRDSTLEVISKIPSPPVRGEGQGPTLSPPERGEGVFLRSLLIISAPVIPES